MHNPNIDSETYANPVMPNGHWSDPKVFQEGEDYYCTTSSIETCPLTQILHSRDLVNWDVIGSVFRQWPDEYPKWMNWGTAITKIGNLYRTYMHNSDRGFVVAEAENVRGPWRLAQHRFDGNLGECDFGPSIFHDENGRIYMAVFNYIRELDPDGLGFSGERINVADGFLENPFIIQKDGWYYYANSEHGTTLWGVTDDRSKISAWRSKSIEGPWEKGPQPLVRSSLRFQCVNTGGPVRGPDGNWYALYNAFDALRPTLCRQMVLSPIDWTDDGWPLVNNNRGPETTGRKPLPGGTPLWIPDLNDEFDAPELEGVTSGILGRKWLFKDERTDRWSLTERPGHLRLKTAYPSLDQLTVGNFVCQRPASSHYIVETHMDFQPKWSRQNAGLVVRELQSQATCAIGLQMEHVMYLNVWHNLGAGHVEGPGGLDNGNAGLKRVAHLPFYLPDTYKPKTRVYLRLVVEGPVIRAFYRESEQEEWISAGPDFVWPWSNNGMFFTAFHPGLFSAEIAPTGHPGHADFDYFHWQDLEDDMVLA